MNNKIAQRIKNQRITLLSLVDHKRGEQILQLRKEDLKVTSSKRQPVKTEVPVEHEALWEALRDCRKRLAEENNVPPYVIFGNKTLRDMIQLMPMSQGEMLSVHGVGESKLEKYGADFIQVINDYAEAL